MKNLFKEAHKMAKEIKAEYPNVDYKTQFGLCLSFLQEEKGDMKMENDNVNIIEVEKWVCPVCGKEMKGRMAKVIKNGEEDFVLEKHCECGHTEREEKIYQIIQTRVICDAEKIGWNVYRTQLEKDDRKNYKILCEGTYMETMKWMKEHNVEYHEKDGFVIATWTK